MFFSVVVCLQTPHKRLIFDTFRWIMAKVENLQVDNVLEPGGVSISMTITDQVLRIGVNNCYPESVNTIPDKHCTIGNFTKVDQPQK